MNLNSQRIKINKLREEEKSLSLECGKLILSKKLNMEEHTKLEKKEKVWKELKAELKTAVTSYNNELREEISRDFSMVTSKLLLNMTEVPTVYGMNFRSHKDTTKLFNSIVEAIQEDIENVSVESKIMLINLYETIQYLRR